MPFAYQSVCQCFWSSAVFGGINTKKTTAREAMARRKGPFGENAVTGLICVVIEMGNDEKCFTT